MPENVIWPIPLVKNVGVSTYKMTHLVGAGSPHDRGSYIWYIEGPGEKILVDAGASTDMPATGGAGTIMFPEGHSEVLQTMEEGLGKLGLRPEDIDIVVFTHLHEDHVGLAHKYPNARLIVQRAELEFARNPHPIQQFTYQPEMLEGLEFETIEGDAQIADGVSVMLTPGHSAAGQSIVIDTAGGKAVITGFCCVRGNFEPPPELGVPVVPTGILLDPIKSYESLLKVKDVADIIIPIHDGEFLEVKSIP